MMRAIGRVIMCGEPAIAEFRRGGVAERPSTHSFVQFPQTDTKRHWRDNSLHLGFNHRFNGERQGGVSAKNPIARATDNAGTARLRRSFSRSRRRGRLALHSPCQAKAVEFTDNRVARHAAAEHRGDLTCAFAVEPKSPQQLDCFICPYHDRLAPLRARGAIGDCATHRSRGRVRPSVAQSFGPPTISSAETPRLIRPSPHSMYGRRLKISRPLACSHRPSTKLTT
jgi:hypothetical protein